MSSCPSPETIGEFANARLSGPRYAAMDAHVETCSACQDILERLAAESSECEIQKPERLPPPEQPPTIPGFVSRAASWGAGAWGSSTRRAAAAT